MKQWHTAILPLSILLALLALTSWLRYVTEMPEERHDGKTRHDPDYIVTDAVLRKLDAQGTLQYTLLAKEIRHYPDSDSTDLLQPKLIHQAPSRPVVTVTAGRGTMSTRTERIDLADQVEVRRAASGASGELRVETPELTVLTDEERAFSKSKVVLTQNKSWVQGVGMQIDNRLQTYVLESQVTGQLESHLGRKKK